MAATRRPSARYTWDRQRDGDSPSGWAWRVNWALHGGNGEHLCDSDNQGFADKHAAQLSLCAVLNIGRHSDTFRIDRGTLPIYVKEVGPGRKPTKSPVPL